MTISFILQFLPFENRDSSWRLLERCCTITPTNQEHTVRYTANPNPSVQVRFLFIINYCFRVRLEPWQSREEENMNWDLAIVCTGNMVGAAVPINQNLEHGQGWKGLPWQVSITHPRKEVASAVEKWRRGSCPWEGMADTTSFSSQQDRGLSSNYWTLLALIYNSSSLKHFRLNA